MQEFYTKGISTDSWDSVGIAVCKPFIYSESTSIIVGYIENNRAYVGSTGMKMYYILSETIDLGPAIDIKVCYDCRWRGDGSGKYKYFTVGEPYIATVDTANRLHIRQGTTGAPVLIATGVESCYLVRGWKHISVPEKDQGLCLFYIKSGSVFSRSYVEQVDGSFVWLNEESYLTLGSTVKDVTAKRTADFRLLIIACSPMNNKVALTTRMFPGMSVPTEVIGIQNVCSTSSTLTQITLKDTKTTENILIDNLKSTSETSFDLRDTEVLGVYNISSTEINLKLTVNPSIQSISSNFYNIIITDSLGYTYPIISAIIEDYTIKLTIMDFSNASGVLEISYLSGLYVYDNVELSSFSTSFTPIGLLPVVPDSPAVQEITNVDTEVV